MTRDEAAAALNGKEYTREGTKELYAAMKAAGLVAVFGASDDLMEFRGAIYDEVGAYDGGTAFLTPTGLFESKCDCDECPYAETEREKSVPIHAKWDDGSGFSWRYETAIPHAKFVILEDDETYCEGIVFSLADVALPLAPKHEVMG